MRVSTGMVFDAGVRKVNDQTAKLLHLQQQISIGKRIVRPSDDPVAAARVLELTQAKDVVVQFATNRDNAQSALTMQETQLQGIGDVISRVREIAIQGGNGTLTRENRILLTAELRARFEELVGFANARDGNGRYIFSGYMGDTRPYSGSVEGGVSYAGDDGQRQLQVSPSRVLEVSDSGRAIFERIKNGNSYYVSNAAASNTGTGIIDSGTVSDPAKWQNPANLGEYEIRFFVDSGNVLTPPGKTYYDIVDADTGFSVFTGAPPDADPASAGFSYTHQYASGQGIPLIGPAGIDLGSSVIITGDPVTGDSFTTAPSTTESLFDTVRNLIIELEAPTGNASTQTLLANRIGFALTNLDQAEQNVLRVRALVGARLHEVESLQAVNEDLNIQYQQSISTLQDLDYAKAISDFTRKQTDLEAAQKSFVAVSQLSLFNYI